MPIVLFQYNACRIAKYDTSMRLINEVHNMQTRYKTEYNVQNINTQTMRSRLHTVLVITHITQPTKYLMASSAETSPLSTTPFLLVQNLFSEWITLTDNMWPKSNDAKLHHYNR